MEQERGVVAVGKQARSVQFLHFLLLRPSSSTQSRAGESVQNIQGVVRVCDQEEQEEPNGLSAALVLGRHAQDLEGRADHFRDNGHTGDFGCQGAK